MKRGTYQRQEGMAIITSLILVVILISFSGAMVFISTAESRGIQESTLQKIAFYAAEAGIEAGKYEIGDQIDPDGDGIGTKKLTLTAGSFTPDYSVMCEDLGGNLWRLTSTGTVLGTHITLQVVVEKLRTSAFPLAAFSSLGNLNDGVVKIIGNSSITFDGGFSPAINVSDDQMYKQLLQTYLKATKKNNLSLQLSGATYLTSIMDGKQLKEVQVPISNEDEIERLTNLEALYTELVTKVTTAIIPTATKALPNQLTYGTAAAPGTFYQANTIALLSGQTLSGNGTLVIHDLRVPKGATVNWNGNIIFIGNLLKTANVDLQGGAINVTGNMVMLGEGKGDALLSVKSGGQLYVDGNLFLGTSLFNTGGKAIKVDLEGGGITVDGIMSYIGGKVDSKFKQGGFLDVEGMFQVGSAPMAGTTKQQIYFDGPAQVVLDKDAIYKAATTWLSLGTALGIDHAPDIVTDEVITHAWFRVY